MLSNMGFTYLFIFITTCTIILSIRQKVSKYRRHLVRHPHDSLLTTTTLMNTRRTARSHNSMDAFRLRDFKTRDRLGSIALNRFSEPIRSPD